jgi:hypothetical protein
MEICSVKGRFSHSGLLSHGSSHVLTHPRRRGWVAGPKRKALKKEDGQMEIGKVERVIEIERIDEPATVPEPQVAPATPEVVPA